MSTCHDATSFPNSHPYPYARIGANYPSLGRHIARRLLEIGVTDVFSVPGDFNLVLLDHLLANDNGEEVEARLNLIGCCNELNAGYAADGYARARGVGACVVTFTVGGLSVINAIAGAYSENLPLICIVGGPNSNDYGSHRILHHTIGLPDFSQELQCFKQVTCKQVLYGMACYVCYKNWSGHTFWLWYVCYENSSNRPYHNLWYDMVWYVCNKNWSGHIFCYGMCVMRIQVTSHTISYGMVWYGMVWYMCCKNWSGHTFAP